MSKELEALRKNRVNDNKKKLTRFSNWQST